MASEKAVMTPRQDARLDLVGADLTDALDEVRKLQALELDKGLMKTATTRRAKGLRKARRMMEAALANVKFLETELNEELKELG